MPDEPRKPLELQQTILYRTMPQPEGYVHPGDGDPFAILSISDLAGHKLTSAYYFRPEDIQTHITALVKLRNEFADLLKAREPQTTNEDEEQP